MPLTVFLSAAVLLVLLLWVEKKEWIAGKLIFKPLLSALFIVTAWLQPWPVPAYTAWVLAALILSWFGDLFLIFASRKMFLAGLIAFLLGHVCYATGFYRLGSWNMWVSAGLVMVLAVGVFIFLWLRPHLGDMMIPVIVYILVISAMVGGALSIFSASNIQVTGKWLVPIGAIVFYASDVLVARDHFVAPGYDNRLFGLPLYYLAQFLFAVSVGKI